MRTRATIFFVLFMWPAFSCAQWTHANSGIIGKVHTLLADSIYLFAGSDSGVFRSSDFGGSWELAGLHDTGIFALAKNDSAMFAGSNLYVFKGSTDGLNWNSVLRGGYTGALAILASGSIVLVGTEQGSIERSTDDGASWSSTASGGKVWYSLLSDGKYFYAGSQYGVDRSTDSGSTWVLSSAGFPAYPEVQALAHLGPTLFAGVGDDYDTSVFLSMDNGESWAAEVGAPPFVCSYAVFGTSVLAGSWGCNVFISSDTGVTWMQFPSDGLADLTSHVVSIAEKGPYLFIAADQSGVWRYPLSDLPNSAVAQTVVGRLSLGVYPNPVSHSATIHLFSPTSGRVEVTIANLLGIDIARIYSGDIEAGDHSFSWNSRGFSPGCYECTVEINGHSNVIPLLVE